MGAGKRLYLYAVSAISLLVLAIGVYNLVAVAFGEIAVALNAGVIGGTSTGREQVSLAISLVVVGSPIFAVHWWLVQRSWRGTDEAARAERRSAIRTFHLGLVTTVALGAAVYAALRILRAALGAVLGAEQDYDTGGISDRLAALLVAVPIGWFHWRRRNADLRHDRLVDSAAWLTRLHRYGWAFIGLMILVFGASGVIATLASVLIGRSGFGSDDRSWLGSLSWSMSMVAVGVGVFWLHVDDARRAIRDAVIIGEDDRASDLRMTYFSAVIIVALIAVSLTVTSSIAALLRLGMAVADVGGLGGVLELVVGPLVAAIPFAIAGWLHWGALRREAAGLGSAPLAAAERRTLHLAAIVGLAFLAVGVARLIGRVLESVVGSVGADDFLRYEVAWFVAQILVGAALWLPAWTVIVRRRAADSTVERHAAASRAYLYLVVGAALLAAVPSAAFTLYRLIDTLLGGRVPSLGDELALPIAAVIVAGAVATYHGRMLVSDLRRSAESSTPIATAAAAPIDAGGAMSFNVSMTLTLRGPGGTDLVAVADGLREHLPAEVVLEVT